MEGWYNLLPLRETNYPMMGTNEWALPGIVAGAYNAFTAPGRALQGRIPESQMVPEAMNFAGNVSLDAYALSRALGKGAIPETDQPSVDVTSGPIKKWFRGQVGAKASDEPFSATAGGRAPSFASDPKVASDYAMNPDADNLYGFGARPKGYDQGGNVAPYTFEGDAFDLSKFQGAHGTQTGMTPKQVSAALKELGIDEREVYFQGWVGKYGKYWDAAEDDVRTRVLPAHVFADDPYVQQVLKEHGYKGLTFKGAQSNPTNAVDNIPWDESSVYDELRALDPAAIKSALR